MIIGKKIGFFVFFMFPPHPLSTQIMMGEIKALRGSLSHPSFNKNPNGGLERDLSSTRSWPKLIIGIQFQ